LTIFLSPFPSIPAKIRIQTLMRPYLIGSGGNKCSV
jgi:hypothetical protein